MAGGVAPRLQLPAFTAPPAGSGRGIRPLSKLLLPTPTARRGTGQAWRPGELAAQGEQPFPVDRLTTQGLVAPSCGPLCPARHSLRGQQIGFENNQLGPPWWRVAPRR